MQSMTTGIGIEGDDIHPKKIRDTDCISIDVQYAHPHLIQVHLFDKTDDVNQLVQTREWQVHDKDLENIALIGNLFIVECPLNEEGKVFIKSAPLPKVRNLKKDQIDFSVFRKDQHTLTFNLHQTGPKALENWTILEYKGGKHGRIKALQDWQQSLRAKSDNHSIPKLMSNSWGDRNRDGRINHDFILREIDTATSLGVDVVQIDDGWQKGITANSAIAKEKGGVWIGFWDYDPNFWDPHPERLPHGLEPLINYAKEKGIEIGLWYAPDSVDEFKNWERDAQQILKIHKTHGVNFFKLDGITTETIKARINLHALLEMVISEADDNIICEIDVTAGKRPGYFDEIKTGTIFLENRYSDWHSYWPHYTLRNLWQLSHWIDPRRLRIEFLNNSRNNEQYKGDPFAPSLYPPATLFAITIFANPLGWFENTGLPKAFITEVSELVSIWKKHRAAIFSGNIIPIGETPNGVTWTGLCSISKTEESCYALLFNEKSKSSQYTFELPRAFAQVELLHGEGEIHLKEDQLKVVIPSEFSYLFLKLD